MTSQGNEKGRYGVAGDRVNDFSHWSFPSAAPAGRPKGTRVFWKCLFCHGKCAESRMTCTFCGRVRREAA